jgi:hypothetical protein
MELLFKIGVTLIFAVLIYYQILFVGGVWRSQVDAKATIARWLQKLSPETDVIATRDPKKIYQNGLSVGDITGEVQEQDSKVVFSELSETGSLKGGQPFEWKRHRLRVISIESTIILDLSGGSPRNNVLKKVVCEEEKH